MNRLFLLLLLPILAAGSGCSMFGLRQGEGVPNPVFIRAASPEMAWERTVDAIHEFRFPIARESKLDGVIETAYVVGSGVFEPWRHDSIGLANRLEDTLQSTRRKLRVRITPARGGYLVAVKAFKEKEDVLGATPTRTGGATFQTNQPLRRDVNVVDADTAPSGWLPLGRDYALEQALLNRIQSKF